MSQHAIVVTGCTQGLGYHAVTSLARDIRSGALKSNNFDLIILSCRNVKAAKDAAAAIAKSSKCDPSKLVVLDTPCDLSNLDSVRSYYAALNAFLGPSKIISLVNNAGIGGNPNYTKTPQGYEKIWATNHLGHFLLTLLCIPNMAEGSRVVNVSSEVHDPLSKTGLPDADEHWPQVKP